MKAIFTLLLQDPTCACFTTPNPRQGWSYGRTAAGGPWETRDSGLEAGVTAQSNPNVSALMIRVGGEAVAPRGEMGAIAHAVQTTPYDQPLCIITDSLSTLQILRRWKRRDFGPWASREKHWDILQVLLDHLSRRTAPTTFLWVKAHTGDPGNEAADRYADRGCEMEDEVHFNCHTHPFQLHDTTGEMISPHGWSPEAERVSRLFISKFQAARVLKEALKTGCKSTLSLLAPDQGNEIMGAILTANPPVITTQTLRDFLQAKGNCFPVGSIVHRNSTWTISPKCLLCGAEVEDYPHMQRGCIKTKDQRQQTHDNVAQALLDSLKEACPHLEITVRPVMGAFREWNGILGPLCKDGVQCPANLAVFTPDGFVMDMTTSPPTGTVIEYSSVFSSTVAKRAVRSGDKHNNYHSCRLALQRLLPGCNIRLQTYGMSIHTEITQPEWDLQLMQYKINRLQARKTQSACALAAIQGFHALASLRRVLQDAVTSPGGGDLSPT